MAKSTKQSAASAAAAAKQAAAATASASINKSIPLPAASTVASTMAPTAPSQAPPAASSAPGPTGPRPNPTFSSRINPSAMKYAKLAYSYKRSILFAAFSTYSLAQYVRLRIQVAKKEHIAPSTYLYWKIYDGAIVEALSTSSALTSLVTSARGGNGGGDAPAKIMTIFEVVQALKTIGNDDRIHGIIADFSSVSVPSAPSSTLGLAQLEELQTALRELRQTKLARSAALSSSSSSGSEKVPWKTVAFTDSFSSQGEYMFASCFDEVWTQPSGQVPLVGLSNTTPFFSKALKWIGIDVMAEARNEYKSFVAPFIAEGLSKPQKDNQISLLNDLNNNLLRSIATNRFPAVDARERLENLKSLAYRGPFSATESVKVNLVDRIGYKQDVIDMIFDRQSSSSPSAPEEMEELERTRLKSFTQYASTMERSRAKQPSMDVGVVYLLGSIGDGGEFGTSAVIKGLKEAGDDKSINSVVLRIDSGGGGVVDSDSIWAAVRDLRNKGKIVIGSFGNASASGGYLVSTDLDAIIANPSTLTGSIGVAALRPNLTQKLLDRLHLTLDSYFTGSHSADLTQPLAGTELTSYRAQVDEMYLDFKGRVMKGRGIDDAATMERLAGGRVYTGLQAFGLTASEEAIRSFRDEEGSVAEAKQVPIAIIEDAAPVVADAVELEKDTSLAIAASTDVVDAEDGSTGGGEGLSTIAEVPLPLLPPSEKAIALLKSVVTKKEAGESANHYGRGLIDGMGGIFDAALLAATMSSAKVLALCDASPKDQDEIMRKYLPKVANDGTSLSFEVRLKRFPQHRSIWQQISEGTQRGDLPSVSLSALSRHVQVAASIWLLSCARNTIHSELEELGLGDWKMAASRRTTVDVGLGKSGRKNWIRAEM